MIIITAQISVEYLVMRPHIIITPLPHMCYLGLAAFSGHNFETLKLWTVDPLTYKFCPGNR